MNSGSPLPLQHFHMSTKLNSGIFLLKDFQSMAFHYWAAITHDAVKLSSITGLF